jgi:hypothetical protein
MTKLFRFAKPFVRAVPTLILACGPVLAQFAQQAQTALKAPTKVVLKVPQVGPREGDPIDFSVQLQNGRDQPVAMPKNSHVEIQLLDSSDAVAQKGTCNTQAGVSEATCSIKAPKAGLYKVKALPSDHDLLDGTGYILVRPSAAPKKQAPVSKDKKRASQSSPHSQFLPVAYEPPPQTPTQAPAASSAVCGATSSPRTAKVILTINEGGEMGGAFRAGLETATIQAFFQADDGGTAPSDIKVWLSPNHGEMDHEPLVIAKCSISGEAHLSSKYAVQTSVVYKVLPSSYAVDAPATLTASFVRPIIGIGVIPTGLQTLSLIDIVPVVVQFFDINGDVMPTDVERTVTFVSNNSIISLKQQSITLKVGEVVAQTMISPSWLGKGSIFVTADRLQTASHDVQVIGQILFLVCLVGGITGGLVLFFTSGGSWYSRVFIGVAAGIVLTWAYVFGLLPKVDSSVAHNYISVFVVSILGGYLGTKAVDLVLKQLGWKT